ncbi:MAG: phosphoglycerate dehydrogenase [Eubacterium sp.]|nr:phosphoglycerate dehydrogenase [Eubacterium sp.]
MFKYACLNPIAAVGLDGFDAAYEKTEDVNEAQAILVRSAAMHDMDLPAGLEVVARAGAGVNNIPLDKCAEQGVVVFNTPGANANGVKELVLTGMLLASRGIVDGINWVTDNKEDADLAKKAEKQKKQYAGTEILGKKLGVIGLGAIGVQVANSAIKLGMEVVGYDPYLSVPAALHLSGKATIVKDPAEIYKNCDFITIHVPLMDATRGMVNAEAIASMKENAVVLNFSRDALVEEEAIVKALKDGKIRRYVCDFPNTTTAGQEGCIVLPHLGASTAESEDNCAIMAVKEIRDYLENGNITNSVNYPNCNLGVCASEGRIAVLHKNVKGSIGKFTAVFGDADINIANMSNASKGDYAYTLLDLDSPATQEVADKLAAIETVFKVRVIK